MLQLVHGLVLTAACTLQNVINQFTQLGQDVRVSYFGNVNVGTDVSLSTLRTLFHGVCTLSLYPSCCCYSCSQDAVSGQAI